MGVGAYVKDPNEVADYPIEWDLDPGDTITGATWNVPAGLIKGIDTFTTTKTVVWLSGGTAGTEYLVTCHITTANGRQFDKTILILVLEK